MLHQVPLILSFLLHGVSISRCNEIVQTSPVGVLRFYIIHPESVERRSNFMTHQVQHIPITVKNIAKILRHQQHWPPTGALQAPQDSEQSASGKPNGTTVRFKIKRQQRLQNQEAEA